MKRYLITIQYLGKNYCGFQKQNGKPTIEQTIETALEKSLKVPTEIFASGRTDAGVNAIAQTAHFDAETSIPASKFPFAINQLLPDDIKITKCKVVSKNFNARFDVKKKTYQYRTYVSKVELPILDETSYWLKQMPNIEKMKETANVLVGKHNFKAFMSAGGQSKTFEREIFDIKITKKSNQIFFEVCGSGFLYNMVRIIVGTLLETGYGKKTPNDIKRAMELQDRTKTGYLVPAKGLFLKKVCY